MIQELGFYLVKRERTILKRTVGGGNDAVLPVLIVVRASAPQRKEGGVFEIIFKPVDQKVK